MIDSNDIDAAFASAHDRPPFANGTEGYGWMAQWCENCLVDEQFQSGKADLGCPLILVALNGQTPVQWIDGPRDEHGRVSIAQQYRCTEFIPLTEQ